jgi:hypothetical protein
MILPGVGNYNAFLFTTFCVMSLLCLCVTPQQCGIVLKPAKLFVWFMSANSLPWISWLQAAMFSFKKIALTIVETALTIAERGIGNFVDIFTLVRKNVEVQETWGPKHLFMDLIFGIKIGP